MHDASGIATVPEEPIRLASGRKRVNQRLLRAVLAASTVLTAGIASAKTRAPTLRDQEQAACYNDAQRLCGEFVPDEDKITACMLRRKAEISKGCLVFFKG